jgi:predicted enzyme related to lactoylglutathione lyase
MHGVVHVEIPAKDLKRAKEWYGKVFGWTFKDMGREYLLWSPPDGGIGGGIYKAKTLPAKSSVRAYLDVTDIDAKLAQIKAARGKIVTPKTEVPGYGWWAAFKDPQGCEVYLWKPAPR